MGEVIVVSDSGQKEYLFPRALEQGATHEEFLAQHELAHWTLSALESVVLATDIADDRQKHSQVINQYNEVAGETRVIVTQGVQRGFLTPEL